MKTKNLLVPIDFSETSKQAAEYAIFLAKKLSSKIIFVHGYTVEYIPFTKAERGTMVHPNPDNIVSDKKLTEKELFQFFDSMSELSKIPHEKFMATGSVVEVICKTAEKKDADLIVMGTKGATAMEGFFIGTNSEKVSRKAKCPVLVVPDDFENPRLDSIALALDTNEVEYTNQLDLLVDIARVFKSKLRIVHISDMDKAAFNKKSVLENYWNILDKVDYSFHVFYEESPEEGLLEFLNEYPADLMIILYRKHGFLERLFDSGVRRTLVFESDVPLLVLK